MYNFLLEEYFCVENFWMQLLINSSSRRKKKKNSSKITDDNFKWNFVNKNWSVSILSIEICSLVCYWCEVIIGLDNGLAPE